MTYPYKQEEVKIYLLGRKERLALQKGILKISTWMLGEFTLADIVLPKTLPEIHEATGYVDAHTHRPEGDSACLRIVSLDAEKDVVVGSCGLFSVGLHPWNVAALNAPSAVMERLRALAAHERVVAVGECGLDRLRAGFPILQEAWFISQLRLAEELGKPLIIHCVRAFDALFRLVKASAPTVPLLVHGYDANAQVASELLRKGFYLSFGAAILRPASHAARLLMSVPGERFFLETDASGVPIETLYAHAARLRGVALGELKDTLYQNFRRVFHPPSHRLRVFVEESS